MVKGISPSSTLPYGRQVWGQLPHAHIFKAGSYVPLPSELALMCCPCEAQGPLFQALQQVKGRDRSYALMTQMVPALLPAADSKDKRERRGSLPH